MFKTGYAVPGDHVFQDLNDKSQFNTSHVSISQSGGHSTSNGGTGGGGTLNSNGGLGGTLSQLLSPSSLSSSHLNGNNGILNRQKKYRTINRLKGLLFTTGSSSSSSSSTMSGGGGGKNGHDNDMSMFELPPQQMKKELMKKIEALQTEINRKQKEREGLVKLKEIYSTNQKFGDSQSALDALKSNDDKLSSLNAQLKKYQDILNELESNASYYSSSSQNHYHQSHYATTNEYALSTTSNGSSTSSNGSGTTLPRDLKSQNIYQSPSEHSVNSNGTSLPGTPMSYHSNGPVANTVGLAIMNSHKSSTIGAYAVSAVSGKLNGNGKMAPMASSDRNESFDDEDELEEEDEDEEDEEEYEETYEKPTTTTTTTTSIQNTAIEKHKTMTTTSAAATAISIVSNSNGQTATNHHTPTGAESPQYDHVDAASLMAQEASSAGLDDDPSAGENEQIIGTALVMYSFAGTVQNAMSIQENESLNVLERDSGDGWTLVKRLNGEKGYVPTDYIQIVYY